MAKGISRFADRDLRYGWGVRQSTQWYPRDLTNTKIFDTSGSVLLPRGDFRIWIIGGGGGGSAYTSNTQTKTGDAIYNNFTGKFLVSGGGDGGICAFEVHIPDSLNYSATLTIGKGGAAQTSGTTATNGGYSRVVIPAAGITATANGGKGGNCTTVTSYSASNGSCTITGASFVVQSGTYTSTADSATVLSLGSSNYDSSVTAYPPNIEYDIFSSNIKIPYKLTYFLENGTGGWADVSIHTGQYESSGTSIAKVSAKNIASTTSISWNGNYPETESGSNGTIAIERI